MVSIRRPIRRRLLPVALVATALTATAVSAPLTIGAASAASPPTCDQRVNATVARLVDCIRTDDLWRHMKAFQAIADAHPGPDGHPSRNSGEAGYKASVDYVAKTMIAAGYDVTIQPYTFSYFSFVGTPVMRETAPVTHDYTLATVFNPGPTAGSVTGAAVQPAGGIVIPPGTPPSASGCTAADFAGFVRGRIALIQRGTCNFGTKAHNAEAAGASGVVIFNEGNTPDRRGSFSGTLVLDDGSPAVLHVPVAFVPFSVGKDLRSQYLRAVAGGTTLPTLTIDVQTISRPNAIDYNVIAESRGGDPNKVLVVDAHLDAIYGAGMLDNASGSAAILDVAQKLQSTPTPTKLRFIWFGGEELGLLGSHHYVDNLSPTQLAKIKFDLDADVLATPNYVAGVLDPKGVNLFGRGPGTPMPPSITAPSRVGRDAGIDYLRSIGVRNIKFSADGTDAFSFEQAGVPASGVLTGQDCCKLPSDVALFGGHTGNFEGTIPSTDGGCVDNPFRWCDNLDNNNPAVLTFMSKTFAAMVATMAFDTDVMSAPRPASAATAAPARAAATARLVR